VAITDQESTEAVTKTPGALGGATLSEIVSGKSPVNILAFNGVKPDVKNLVNGTYPLLKSFYLVTTPKTSPAARDFAKFITSAPAGKVLSESGNMPVGAKPGK
jgi:phosphate transport system substrate-binding protein